jgi:hypothetical protein
MIFHHIDSFGCAYMTMIAWDAAPQLQGVMTTLHLQQVENKLNSQLARRRTPQALRAQGVLLGILLPPHPHLPPIGSFIHR